MEYAGTRTNVGVVMGADEGYPEIYGGELTDGRWFTRNEQLSGAPAIVLSTNVALKLFGAIQPIDKWIRVGGRPMRVIGIYQEAANIFQPPGQEVHGIMPYRTMDRAVHARQDERGVHSGQAAPGRDGRRGRGGGDHRVARGAALAAGAITTTST